MDKIIDRDRERHRDCISTEERERRWSESYREMKDVNGGKLETFFFLQFSQRG